MKLSFALVALEVEKIYSSISHESQLDTRCRVISTYLEACGWTEEEYWAAWLSYQEGLTN